MRHKDKVSALENSEKFHPPFHLSEFSCGEAGETGRTENLRTGWGSWLEIRLSDEPFERQGSRARCTQLFGIITVGEVSVFQGRKVKFCPYALEWLGEKQDCPPGRDGKGPTVLRVLMVSHTFPLGDL